MKMKASDLLVRALENEGVEYIFGIPGEENLDFLESLRHSSIKLILTRHEQGAGFMAATYGRLTGKPGVCLSTLGPGATNFVTAAAYAQLGGMPMVMITGQKPIRHSKQGQFQIVDIVELMRATTKYTRQIVDGSRIPSTVREAFRLAMEERPGAVHIELPEDIAAEEVDAEFCQPFPVHQVRRPSAERSVIELAAATIAAARSPLILVGAGANRNRTRRALTDFIAKTGIPFFNTQMGAGVVDESNPLYLGTAALSSNDVVHLAIAEADLIINVGHDVIEKPPFLMERGGCQVLHINYFGARVDDVYFPQQEIIGDIANSLSRLTHLLKPCEHWQFDHFKMVKRYGDQLMARQSACDQFPLAPDRVVADVRAALPDDGIVCLDNGLYKLPFARNYRAHQPNTLLLDNALATMGAGMPSAMAAKLIYPQRKVVAVCGDGGFLMNAQELETAVRLQQNLVVLILNDSAYGMIKWKQEQSQKASFGLDFQNPDFVAFAAAHGAHGHRITATGELLPKLAECLSRPGVHIIDVPINYGACGGMQSQPHKQWFATYSKEGRLMTENENAITAPVAAPVAEKIELSAAEPPGEECGCAEEPPDGIVAAEPVDSQPVLPAPPPVSPSVTPPIVPLSTDILTVRSPHDGSLVGTLPLHHGLVDQALSYAQMLYQDRRRWLPPHRRIAILEKLASLMQSRKSELVNTAVREGGKPYTDTLVEFERAVQGVKLGINAIHSLHGEQVPMGLTSASINRMAFTTLEPIGVVVALSAFNHPLNLIIHQVIPAIAAGCPVIVKPASATPLSCLLLVKLLYEAGLPEGYCQVLLCDNAEAEKLVTDPRVGFLSFIGSAKVGWYLRSKLAPGTRCALEHGGVAPVIVDRSADLEEIIKPLVKGAFYHAGQVCVSVKRVFVPAEEAERFCELIAARTNLLKVGNPADPATEVGPLISSREVDRVSSWVQEAIDAGAKLICGGNVISPTYYEPTVLLNPPEDVRVSREEIFGPVMCVYSYDTLQDAVNRSNDLPYAFQAAVFSKDLEAALGAAQGLNATAVMVNDHTAFRVDWMPFGGRKGSGLGMGGIAHSAREMSQEKLIVFKSDQLV